VPSHLFRASYSYDQGSYLAFLVPDRGEGPEDAIRIAEAVGMPLRIAAKIPRPRPPSLKNSYSLTSMAKG